MALPRYSSYRNSDIDWVGDIPTHWEVERAKWLFKREERSVRPDDDIVTAFRDGTVTLRSNRRTEGFTTALQEHGYQGIRKGDLVIHAMDAFAGAIGVSDSDGKATPVYSACINRGEYYTNNHYYAYLLRYMSKAGYIESLAKGIRERSTDFRFNDFAKLNLPIPPREEQDRIANFLDQKTAEIDEAIAKKQRLIELLKEQKAILINRAVTKGLNPDAPMRDSGVEWIGGVPAGWEVKKLKFIKSSKKNAFVDGPFGSNLKSEHFIEDGDVYVIESGHITDGYFAAKERFKTISMKHFQTICRSEACDGDIIIAKIGARYGMCGILPSLEKKCVVSGNSLKFTPNASLVKTEYLHHALLSAKHAAALIGIVNVSAQPALSLGGLNNISVMLPPLGEQIGIIEYVENLISSYDETQNKVETAIGYLQELKQSVIASAVTGKIKI